MSRAVDLMPASCREALGRRALIRRWAFVYIGTIVLIFTVYTSLGIGKSARDHQRAAMTEQVKINWNRSEVVQQLLRQIAESEAAITRYNNLAWPVKATEAIEALAAHMPPEIALTELSITPREEKKPPVPAQQRGAAAPAAPEPPRTFMVIELAGIAPSDRPIASFVSGLDDSPLYTRVALDFTRSKEVAKAEVRSFRITCEIDLSARYAFAEPLVAQEIETDQEEP